MFVQKLTFHTDFIAKIELKDCDNNKIQLCDGKTLKPTRIIYKKCSPNDITIEINVNNQIYIGNLSIEVDEGEVEYRIKYDNDQNVIDIYRTENGYKHDTCLYL